MQNLECFRPCDEAKNYYPDLYVIVFMVAEGIDQVNFGEWHSRHRLWVQIGVYGQEKDNIKKYIKRNLEILRPFLPKDYLYRPQGYRWPVQAESMLKDLGFAGIAYRTKIKYFNGKEITKFINVSYGNDQGKNYTSDRNVA